MPERRLPIASKCLLAPGLRIPLPFTLALGLLACGPSVRDFGDTSGSSTGSGSMGEGGAGGGVVDLGKGPKLVKSDPPNGDTQASIQQYFTLFFDRPVSSVNATGKIKVASDAHPEPAFVQVGPCPDNANDPTCIAGAYPDAFLDMDPNNAKSGRHLPSNTKVTVTIDKTFKDTDGNVNNLDTTLSFTTFKYDLRIIDDSKAVPEEAGGLDYDPKSQALFLCGFEPTTGSLIVRKIGVPMGEKQPIPSTFYQQGSLPGGNLCYGLDIAEGQAYVSATYSNQVWIMSGLDAPSTKPSKSLTMTSLAKPNDALDQVKSVAAFSQGDSLLFGFGRYLGSGTSVSGILSYNSKMGWSLWQKLETPSEGFTLAPATDATGSYVYVALKDRILKVDLGKKAVVNTHMLPAGSFFYETQMRVDTKGRLYFGDDNGGLTVYDTSGTQGFKVLAKREGLPMGRFGIRESGKDVDIFFMRFRDKAIIGSTTISF